MFDQIRIEGLHWKFTIIGSIPTQTVGNPRRPAWGRWEDIRRTHPRTTGHPNSAFARPHRDRLAKDAETIQMETIQETILERAAHRFARLLNLAGRLALSQQSTRFRSSASRLDSPSTLHVVGLGGADCTRMRPNDGLPSLAVVVVATKIIGALSNARTLCADCASRTCANIAPPTRNWN